MLAMTAEHPFQSETPVAAGVPAPAADTHEVPNLLKFYDITTG